MEDWVKAHWAIWWVWMQANPWKSVLGAIVLFGAIGRAVKWWYEVKNARREDKAAAREREISAMLDEIEELDGKTPQGLRSVPKAEKGESQEIVDRAWERFIAKRSHGNPGRF